MNELNRWRDKCSSKGSYQMLSLQEIIIDYFMLLETLIFDSSHCCFRIHHSEVSADHRDHSGILEHHQRTQKKVHQPLYIKRHNSRTGKHCFPNSGQVFKIILEEMLPLAVIQHCCISDWNPDEGIPTWLPWAGFATVRDNIISFSNEPH